MTSPPSGPPPCRRDACQRHRSPCHRRQVFASDDRSGLGHVSASAPRRGAHAAHDTSTHTEPGRRRRRCRTGEPARPSYGLAHSRRARPQRFPAAVGLPTPRRLHHPRRHHHRPHRRRRDSDSRRDRQPRPHPRHLHRHRPTPISSPSPTPSPHPTPAGEATAPRGPNSHRNPTTGSATTSTTPTGPPPAATTHATTSPPISAQRACCSRRGHYTRPIRSRSGGYRCSRPRPSASYSPADA